jgi:UDP:flavonoid glycosyltransferase YjiC (YdhE family)
VRILFTFVGGAGHFNPLVPIARAAAAGHVVAFAGPGSMAATVVAAGFEALPTGAADDSPAASQATRIELRPPDAAHEAKIIRTIFAGRLARERAAALLPIAAAWQPDVIVAEEMDFGALVAAERLGLPYATVLVIAAGSFVPPELIATPLNALRAEHDLPPDPELTMLSRYLVISPFPPSYRDPRFPLPATAHTLRPFAVDRPIEASAGGAALPSWWGQPGAAPAVYLTLGTVFNLESGDLMARLVAALRTLPINLIATVGQAIDPAELGPQPPNVWIEPYIAQSLLLPHCRLVVSHGGSGTVIGALTHGLPLVVIPLGADQMVNAERCAALGVGRVLDVMAITPELAREAVTDVLANPSYRHQAERIRDEVAGLPGPEHVVSLLERLVAEGRPLTSD